MKITLLVRIIEYGSIPRKLPILKLLEATTTKNTNSLLKDEEKYGASAQGADPVSRQN